MALKQLCKAFWPSYSCITWMHVSNNICFFTWFSSIFSHKSNGIPAEHRRCCDCILYCFILAWCIPVIERAKMMATWFEANTQLSSPYIWTKVVNSVSIGVSFFQLKRNVSVSKCFGVPFRGCTVHIYIYIYIYIFNKHNSNSR